MTTTSLIPESTFRPQNYNEEGEAPPPYSATADPESTSSIGGVRPVQQQGPAQYQFSDQGHVPPLALAPTRLPSAPSMAEEDHDHIHTQHSGEVSQSLTHSHNPQQEGQHEKTSTVIRPPSPPPMTKMTNSWIPQEQHSLEQPQTAPLSQNTWRPRRTPSMSDVPMPPHQVALTQSNDITGGVGGESVGPGLVMHYRCQDCGGQLSSESEVCKRLQCFSKTMRQSIRVQPDQFRQHRPLSSASTEALEVPYHSAARSSSPSRPQPPNAYYASESTRTSPATAYSSYSSHGSSAPHAPYGTSTPSAPHGTSTPPAPYGISQPSSSSSPSSADNRRSNNYSSFPQVLRSVSARSPVVSSVKKFWKDVRNEYRYQSGGASPSGYYKRPSSMHQSQSSQLLDYVVAPAPIPLLEGPSSGLTYPPPPLMASSSREYLPPPSAQAHAPLGRSGPDSGYPSRPAHSS